MRLIAAPWRRKQNTASAMKHAIDHHSIFTLRLPEPKALPPDAYVQGQRTAVSNILNRSFMDTYVLFPPTIPLPQPPGCMPRSRTRHRNEQALQRASNGYMFVLYKKRILFHARDQTCAYTVDYEGTAFTYARWCEEFSSRPDQMSVPLCNQFQPTYPYQFSPESQIQRHGRYLDYIKNHRAR